MLALSSCDEDSIDPSLSDLELSNQFRVSLHETFDQDGTRRNWIYVESIEEFNCDNFGLDVRYEKYGAEIYLYIDGLKLDGFCQEGTAKATAEIELTNFSIGDYSLHMTLLDDIETVGTISNHADHIDISFPDDSWIEIGHSRTTKIPEQSVWGYFIATQSGTGGATVNYINDLEGFGSPFENDGFYGAFRISNGQVRVIENLNNTTEQHIGFGMKYTGDLEELRTFVYDNYCPLAGTISLQSTQGSLDPCD